MLGKIKSHAKSRGYNETGSLREIEAATKVFPIELSSRADRDNLQSYTDTCGDSPVPPFVVTSNRPHRLIYFSTRFNAINKICMSQDTRNWRNASQLGDIVYVISIFHMYLPVNTIFVVLVWKSLSIPLLIIDNGCAATVISKSVNNGVGTLQSAL